ncbi:hypothetical protein FGO68_gene13342 [Halteria grandinella]|uniref:Uncharacterized protein n=1 Tax=Halteria grandinella TaxID=5974 RepID=A0A8J8NDJ1_HALGN|nr:hypothetical protein FGO68_gene13342 [Halteria grandinella]
MRTGLRTKLQQFNKDLSTPQEKQSMAWQAKEELLRTFTDKEGEMNQVLEKRERVIDDQRKKVRALKRYAREIKYLAEEWAPPGQPLPEVISLPPPVALEDDEDDDYLRRQQTELERLKNRNRNLEDDIRKLTDARPNASVSVDARGAEGPTYHDKSLQNSVRGIDTKSVAASAKTLQDNSEHLQKELERANQKSNQYQSEIDRLKASIRELEGELQKQKDSYVRKSSTKMTPQSDPELERMRGYIRQLEDEIGEMKRQMGFAQKSEREVEDLKRQLEKAQREIAEARRAQAESARKSISLHSAGVQKDDASTQDRILQELNYLKQNPQVLQKPGTSHGAELDRLRRERDSLIEENRKLKALINEDSAGPTSGNAKYLKNKIFHLDKTLAQLEKERSELSVRATMAEEQLKNLQEHLSTNTHSYQKKIYDMKKILKAKGVDVSVF